MPADVAGAIMCHHVATYVYACVGVHVISELSILFKIYANPLNAL